MKKTILEIYCFAVCFVTVVCFVIAFGILVYGAIGIVNPDFTVPSRVYTQHQTNDDFWTGQSSFARLNGSENKPVERPAEEELTKQRQASYTRAIESERRDNFQSVVRCSIVVLIDVIVFFFHWTIALRERKSAA